MINIKVNSNGKETELKCDAHIEGYKNAVNEFYAVLRALSDYDEDVLLDALGRIASDKMAGGGDDGESKS